ncbi:MAG: hypothetical protein AAB481_00895 [Patescibacteria group bacterium]
MNDDTKKTLPAVGTVFLILSGIVLLAYQYSRPRTSAIVLPGGVTYLGPSPTQNSGLRTQDSRKKTNKIPVAADAVWATQTGKKYPYTFLYPSTLSLGVFPNDPYDAVTIFWGDTNPQENLLLRVENINACKESPCKTARTLLAYVLDWWKDYTWKGVADITEFKNSKGLKGYRAKYLDGSGFSPFDHVFFEVPNRPELVIWLSGKMLEKGVFDKIVESVEWKSQ